MLLIAVGQEELVLRLGYSAVEDLTALNPPQEERG
jgi:hypothetical protein